METFVICVLIIVSFAFLTWEVRSIGQSIVKAVNEHVEEEIECDVDEAVGESEGVPVIIGLIRRNGNHPNIRCDICDNEQCLTCNGRTCVKCGVEIGGDPVTSDWE